MCNKCSGCECNRHIDVVHGSCGFDENGRAEFNGDVETIEYCSETTCIKKGSEHQ